MRWWISLAIAASLHAAGPVEFGKAELDAAISSRNFRFKPRVVAELNLDPPETFRIEPYTAGGGHISGGDLRGLMYGLLEAAQQMRAGGRFKQTHGVPATAIRGVRMAADVETAWFRSPEFWRAYFQELARNRFNRLQLAFENVPAADIVPLIRTISQTATQFGVDVALGLTNYSAESAKPLAALLAQCPLIHAVVYESTSDARENLAEVLNAAGRRIVLYPLDHDSYVKLEEPVADDAETIRSTVAAQPAGFEIPSPKAANGWPDVLAAGPWGRTGYEGSRVK